MRIFLFTLFLFFTSFATAQEQLGLRTDNFSGIHSVLINPANGVLSKFKWDVNVVSAGFHFDNDYVFINDNNPLNVWRNRNNVVWRQEYGRDVTLENDEILVDFFYNRRRRHAYLDASIMGPSLQLNLWEGHSIGFYSNFRAVGGTHDLPSNTGFYEAFYTNYNQSKSIAETSVAGISYLELGLSYSYLTEIDRFSEVSVGANLKFLLGYEAVFMKNNRDFEVSPVGVGTFDFYNPDWDFGATTTNVELPDGLPLETINPSINGRGFGIDFGANYIARNIDNEIVFKLGVSLLDMGSIKYSKNTQRHKVLADSAAITLDLVEYDGDLTYQNTIDRLDRDVYNDADLITVANEFSVTLPTAISLQADIRVFENTYFNFHIQKRTPFGEISAKRANLYAFTPRYESRWFGVSVPLSFYNDKYFYTGLALRMAFLTIGTDNISPLFGNKEYLTGANIYFALKVNPFNWKYERGMGCYNW